MLEVSEKEEGVVALHLAIGPLKTPTLGWSCYQDSNPVSPSPLADDFATVPSGPVTVHKLNLAHVFPHPRIHINVPVNSDFQILIYRF